MRGTIAKRIRKLYRQLGDDVLISFRQFKKTKRHMLYCMHTKLKYSKGFKL